MAQLLTVPPSVTLSYQELRAAAYEGVNRQIRALCWDLKPLYGLGREEWLSHIWGALGECAVAKATGTYWGPTDGPDRHRPDVGTAFHVRTVKRAHYRLMLHPDDPDEGVYVLVACQGLPRFEIVGQCVGRDGKREEYWEDPVGGRPAYFVPHRILRPFIIEEMTSWH